MNDIPEPVKTKINANGRIVLPAAMRAAIGVNPGDEVLVRVIEGEIRVSTFANAVRQAQELVRRYLKPGSGSLVDALIRERRAEAQREQQEWTSPSRARKAHS